MLYRFHVDRHAGGVSTGPGVFIGGIIALPGIWRKLISTKLSPAKEANPDGPSR